MKYIKNIILVVLIVLVGYNIFTNNSIRTDVEAYNRKIDSLQNEIDSVENANVVLDGHIEKVDNELTQVETRVITINKKILFHYKKNFFSILNLVLWIKALIKELIKGSSLLVKSLIIFFPISKIKSAPSTVSFGILFFFAFL